MTKTIYVLSEGRLSVDENVYRFDSNGELIRFPPYETESIEIYGGGSLTSGVFSLSSKNNIPIHFFGYYGNYEGTYWPKEVHFSGDLSIRQSALFLDFNKRIELCNILVNGIRTNMKATLVHYKSTYDELFNNEVQKKSVQDLMMEEGRLWKKYYSEIDTIVFEPFRLEQRIKHPTLNHGNSLISFFELSTVC